MNVIQCYVPTSDSNDDDDEDRSYGSLQSILEKYSGKNLIIMMRNLNAKVGMDNNGYEDIMGRHGLGERNESAERSANLLASNQSVMGGIIFTH
ncbi:unnamed protein product [Schistosoma margrebowiei]|uniref:Uncharacterized protein n=1 Tax=Schistosoma margrebowiei TaxID=48269 RepID=A0A183LID2_9TREM|nr:unnamed protein product [Schistosoma margrebowiei]